MKVIIENIRVEIEELFKEIEEIFLTIRRNLEQERTMVVEMLKALTTTNLPLQLLQLLAWRSLKHRKLLQCLVQAVHFLKKRRKC